MFWKKKIGTEIQIESDGFRVNSEKELTSLKWTDIESITAFKIDRITVDVICLRLVCNQKVIFISEEEKYWSSFVAEMEKQFPEINAEWWPKVAYPPFERNETIIFDRNK